LVETTLYAKLAAAPSSGRSCHKKPSAESEVVLVLALSYK